MLFNSLGNKKILKEPLLAVLFSLLLPGLGQAYAGEKKRGVIFFSVSAILSAGTVVYALNPATSVSPLVILPILFSLALYFYCPLDSYRLVKVYNTTHGLERTISQDKKRKLIAAIISAPLLCCLLVPLLGSFFLRIYIMPPNSMEPTIYKGECVLVNMLSYKISKPRRGDLVMYRCPEETMQIYLHRLVGLPGESVLLKDHKVFINGEKLTETWALKVRHYNGGKLARRGMKPIDIPEDSYFVLGDYAARSRDSRYWGSLPKKNLLGRVYKICYPFDRSGRIE